MTKQLLYEAAILACIIFSSGFSGVVFYNLFVINVLKRK